MFIIGTIIFLVQLEVGLKIVLSGLGLVFFVAVTLINYWYEAKYYEKYFYDFETDFLVIRKGVFMPTETTLPWNKIQDVYLDQDLLDRVFKLWDLHVSTATIISGYHAHIDGVSRQDAEAMREIILKTINREKVV
jgi:putative membrane protein